MVVPLSLATGHTCVQSNTLSCPTEDSPALEQPHTHPVTSANHFGLLCWTSSGLINHLWGWMPQKLGDLCSPGTVSVMRVQQSA